MEKGGTPTQVGGMSSVTSEPIPAERCTHSTAELCKYSTGAHCCTRAFITLALCCYSGYYDAPAYSMTEYAEAEDVNDDDVCVQPCDGVCASTHGLEAPARTA